MTIKESSMVHNDQVEIINPVHMPHSNDRDNEHENQRLQKKKWLLLFGSFLITLIITQSWVWLRAPIFQSTATLHFTYNKSLKDIPQSEIIEQLSLNQKRLLSISMFQEVNNKIKEIFVGEANLEMIGSMLTAEVIENNNTINLKATGENPEILSLALNAQLERYFTILNKESSQGSEEKIQNINEMLVSIERKIEEQQLALSEYSELHNIVSLERAENRVLNKISALNRAIDEAEGEQLTASENLKRIEVAERESKVLLNPKDIPQIDSLKAQIEAIELELKEFSEIYTPQYMEKDPKIKGIVSNYKRLQGKLTQRVNDSQVSYKEESQSALLESESKIDVLNSQLKEFGANAQVFDQKLKEFNRMTNTLNMLADQSQTLKNELVAHEVQQPLMPTIKVIEEPYTPTYPISPNYLIDALIACAVAVAVSVFCLIIFSFIVRQKHQSATVANYTIIPPQAQTNAINQQQLLAAQEQERLQLQNQSTPLQLSQETTEQTHLRLLADTECQRLYENSTAQGQLVLALLFSGVHQDELNTLTIGLIDDEQDTLHLQGERHSRVISIHEKIAQLLKTLKSLKPLEATILDDLLTPTELTEMFINTAHDAELDYPDQLSVEVIRHTYLTYLAKQNIKINELEKVAGSISPSEVARYRGLKRNDITNPIEVINTFYPLEY